MHIQPLGAEEFPSLVIPTVHVTHIGWRTLFLLRSSSRRPHAILSQAAVPFVAVEVAFRFVHSIGQSFGQERSRQPHCYHVTPGRQVTVLSSKIILSETRSDIIVLEKMEPIESKSGGRNEF